MSLFPKLSQNAGLCLSGMFIFALFGVFLLPWMIWSRARVQAMTQWPVADAEVVGADVTSTWRRGAGTTYQHALTYRFTVAGRVFTGDRMIYGGAPPEWGSEAEARNTLPAIGSRLPVRYAPDNPADSVIKVILIPVSSDLKFRWFAGVIGAAGAILMLVTGMAWRAEKR